jgi:hypothetical protein
MAFPSSPSTGQVTTVNGVSYIYDASFNRWKRIATPIVANILAANTFVYSANGTSILSDVFSAIAGANVAITTSNTALKAYVDDQISADVIGWQANAAAQDSKIAGANAAIIAANTIQSNQIDTLKSQVYSNANVDAHLSSSGAGNITISSGAFSLTQTGPGAVNAGSSTSIPTIVTDAYGRIVSLTSNAVSTTISLAGTTGTGSIAGGGTLTFSTTNGMVVSASGSTLTVSTPQDLRTSATPTYAGINVNGNATVTGGVYTTGLYWSANGNVMASGITYTASTTAPTVNNKGDQWYNTSTDVLYEYINDGSSSYWIDMTTPIVSASGTSGGGSGFSSGSDISVGNLTIAGDINGPFALTRSYKTYANTASADTLIDTFTIAQIRSAKYQIQLSAASAFQASEIMLLQDSGNVFITEYGNVYSSSRIGTFSANISSDLVNLYVNAADSNTEVIVYRQGLLNNSAQLPGDLLTGSGSLDLLSASGSLDLMV